MKYLGILILVFTSIFNGSSVFAQEKIEKEIQVNVDNIPQEAREVISQFEINKVNWYKEQSNNGFSFEAKFKFKKQFFSVEFDTTGQLEDVEIIVPEKEMKPSLLEAMAAQLDKDCDKYDFRKFQIQYSGQKDLVIQHVIEQNTLKSKPGLKVQYEVVVKVKIDGNYHLYEYTFDAFGGFISKVKKALRNTDNLDY